MRHLQLLNLGRELDNVGKVDVCCRSRVVPQTLQVLFLHMRLMKPYKGKVEYEQRYNVSSWGSTEMIDPSDSGNMSACEIDKRCVELTQNKTTDKMIKCKSSDE